MSATAGMQRNRLKVLLSEGKVCLGRIVQFSRNPEVIRLLAVCGYDFVWVDTQHSDLSIETVGSMCAMARAAGITPIVRPYGHDGRFAARVLDIGAMGLMYMDVRTRQQVDGFIEAIFYPPIGSRPGHWGPASDHFEGPTTDMMDFLNDNLLLAVQLESQEALDNLKSIVSGGRVDMVQIGRHDLSTALGVPHEIRHPKVLDAIDRVVEIASRYDTVVEAGVYSPEELKDFVARGLRCFHYQNDYKVLKETFGRDIATARQVLGSA
jgi:2-keto-3-deoxy-L-rhamnonate aldolase RhmA